MTLAKFKKTYAKGNISGRFVVSECIMVCNYASYIIESNQPREKPASEEYIIEIGL